MEAWVPRQWAGVPRSEADPCAVALIPEGVQ